MRNSTPTCAHLVIGGPAPYKTRRPLSQKHNKTISTLPCSRGYHPLLFLLVFLLAVVEIGLTAWFVDHFDDTAWPTEEFHSLTIFLLFNACWTALFSLAYVWWIVDGAVHFLASVAGSTAWLLVTTILWGIATAMLHDQIKFWDCTNTPILSICREAEAIEAIGWTEFALCILTILAACFWVRSTRRDYVWPT